LKSRLFEEYRAGSDGIDDLVSDLLASRTAKNKAAKAVNERVNAIERRLLEAVATLPRAERATVAVAIKYCGMAVGIEARNSVWPYDNLSFSRRIGEYWEKICACAWQHATSDDIEIMEPPEFSTIRRAFLSRIWDMVGDHERVEELVFAVDEFTSPLDRISMKSDVVFLKGGTCNVVDFKSGFCSNERGNMDRLSNVGWAYRQWDAGSVLHMLVRQEVNNKYLDTLRSEGVWQVATGRAAYRKVAELTGVDIESVCNEVIDWRGDLGCDFYGFLKGQPKDLTAYLEWMAEMAEETEVE